MNSLSTSRDQLCEAGRQLSTSWNVAKEVWNDVAREDFENDFWAEFETTTATSVAKLDELINTIAQAEREIP